ncbi:MAG: magnesium/cobalt transporter CorA [Persicimonas sp.]
MSPGAVHDVPDAPPPVLRVLAYGPDAREDAVVDSPDKISDFQEQHEVVWLDVEGVGDARVLTKIGEQFGFPRLALEDVQNQDHRAKVELYDDQVHVILKMIQWRAEGLEIEQINLFAGPGFVVTFRTADCSEELFTPIRERISGTGRLIREKGADYLAYALIDRVIDAGFPVLQHFAEVYDQLEADVVASADPELLTRIHTSNSQLLVLRRAVRPHREVVQTLRSNPDSFFSDAIDPFLKDCLDHAVQISELADNYHALGNQVLDFFLSLSNHRQTEITKVLTIIATLFIPLTFIAGIYGMNFDPEASPYNMPELEWAYGYPAALSVMLVLTIGLIYYFYRKGWIGQ